LSDAQLILKIKAMTKEATQAKQIQVTPLWYTNFYDGVLAGFCEVDGNLCWFRVEDTEQEYPWNYFVYALNDDEIKEEKRRHQLFREYVGTHTDFGESSKVVRPQSMWSDYYSQQFKPEDYSSNEIIGSFVETRFKDRPL